MGVEGVDALTKKLGGFIWFNKVGQAIPLSVRNKRVERDFFPVGHRHHCALAECA